MARVNIHRACLYCGRLFDQIVEKGRGRIYCSDNCRRAVRAANERARRADLVELHLCPRCKRPVPI